MTKLNTHQRFMPSLLAIFIIFSFLISRLIYRIFLELSPDAKILEQHWQHSDLTWLDERFWETLYYLHSQPPAWNAIIGAVVAIVGPDSNKVADSIALLFSAMSLSMMFVFIKIGCWVGLRPIFAALVGLAIAASPTTVYYELYPFYPHLTAFLMTLLLAASARADKGGMMPVIALFAVAVALCWIWSVFHPIFIIYLAGIFLIIYPAARTRITFTVIAVAFIFSCMPTLKNSALLGSDFASSWLGMNLTQTLPDLDPEYQAFCKFETVVDALVSGRGLPGVEISPIGVVSVDAMIKPVGGYANMNNLLVSKRAEDCFEIYLERLVAAPGSVLMHLGERIIDSHSKPAFVYAFSPEGWSPEIWVMRAYYKFQPLSQIASVLYYALLVSYGLWRLRRREWRRPVAMALSIIVYFTITTHVANGIEQERMRVSIEPLYWFLLIMLISDLFNRRNTKNSPSDVPVDFKSV